MLKAAGVNVDWNHITVIPVHGTHFASFEALFSKSCLNKRCATIRDGDQNRVNGKIVALLDDGNSIQWPVGDDLRQTFANKTTFELAISQRETIGAVIAAVEASGLHAAARRLRDAAQGGKRWELVQLQVLRAAMRIGKARFAQMVAGGLASASYCPAYIVEAVSWLQRP
jgi:putative ATP-dependent endonuclease of OLD family